MAADPSTTTTALRPAAETADAAALVAAGDAAEVPVAKRAMPFTTDVKEAITEIATETGRKILVAMDGTEFSSKAAVWVHENIAKPDDVIILVSVWEEAMVEKLFRELTSELIHPEPDLTYSKHAKLHETFESARCLIDQEKLHGLIVELAARAAPKSIGEELCQLAAAMSADLIVCGTRGLGGLKKALLGSVSSHLASNAPCAITIVK